MRGLQEFDNCFSGEVIMNSKLQILPIHKNEKPILIGWAGALIGN